MRKFGVHILFGSNEPDGAFYITMWARSFEQLAALNCENGMARRLLLADGACGDGGVGGFDEIFADDFLSRELASAISLAKTSVLSALGSMRVIEVGVSRSYALFARKRGAQLFAGDLIQEWQ